jgi:hypothetical protein
MKKVARAATKPTTTFGDETDIAPLVEFWALATAADVAAAEAAAADVEAGVEAALELEVAELARTALRSSGIIKGVDPAALRSTDPSPLSVCVGSKEVTSKKNVLSNKGVRPLGEGSQVDVTSPFRCSGVARSLHVGVGGIGGNIGIVSSESLHHARDGHGSVESVGWVNDTEHSFLAVGGGSAVEEGRVSVIDNLVEHEALVLLARREGAVRGLVARGELRGLGDGVVVSTPHK